MFRRSPLRSSARWPFWLLLAAWFCANSPQAATYEIVVWLGNARTFSHQQRLTSEVAFILGGQPAAATMMKAHPAERSQHLPPAMEIALKKIDLLMFTSSETASPLIDLTFFRASSSRVPWACRSEPPSEPPRSV